MIVRLKIASKIIVTTHIVLLLSAENLLAIKAPKLAPNMKDPTLI